MDSGHFLAKKILQKFCKKMAYSELITLFLQLSIMLLFALIFRWIMVRIQQPAGFGVFLAGIILGPILPGAFAHSVFSWLFQSSHAIEMAQEAVIQMARLFFLFSAGLEVNPKYLQQHKKLLILTGSPGIFIPFVIVFFRCSPFPISSQQQRINRFYLPFLWILSFLRFQASPGF